ncbi:lamin tail domain-containing protein [Abyssalbus ytuae]|uniref:Lamin tail domain-containing protein n=1 Tax=Abyssalbus ytuae TaxID=2926907 RepID=A0A9E6ZM88_9FLAO|nr:lamin tail domain-containing protein [Abyssalbus ytuae]UOB16880.1 lamin tail domain-containing protein [Abyssalbus ytuae]
MNFFQCKTIVGFIFNQRKNKTFYERTFLFVVFFLLYKVSVAQGIIINEVSNGPSGSQEWVELLVTGNPLSPTANVDLTGWIIDDNNGDFEGNLTGVGIATGHIQFSNILNNVPPGSLIVIYNDTVSEQDPALPPNDPSDIDNDGIYVLAANDVAFNVCTTTPTVGDASYNCTDIVVSAATVTNVWSRIGLRNGGDAFQIRKPDGTFFHGFSYGDVGAPFPNFPSGKTSFNAGTGGSGSTFSFSCGDWEEGSNYSQDTTTRTPGIANDSSNQIFINKIVDGSLNYTNLSDPANCSSCSITEAGVSNIACDDNGTPFDTSDDTFSFTLNPQGEGLGTTYSVSGDITANGISYGVATSFGPYPALAGNLSITITDEITGTCQLANVVVASPGPCLDADGDGIENEVDLDDDNDGILDVVECGNPGNDNLVLNGDFSSGYFDNWTGGGSLWQNVNQYAFFEEYSAATEAIEQTITVTPTVQHTLSFDLGTISTYANSTIFNVYVEGNLVYTTTSDQIFTNNGGDSAHTGGGNISNTSNISVNFIPVLASVTIKFEGSALVHSHDELFLDNVMVSVTNSCEDTDGDGVPNNFDLDSDNDGIYDIIEAGHDQSFTNGIFLGTVGIDGVPDTVQDAGQENSGTVNYSIRDSDGDNVYDFLESDSDNDGCNDVIEAGFTSSTTTLGELNGTGYDSSTGLVSGNSDGYSLPADNDSNSMYDFRETGTYPSITTHPVNQNVAEGGTAIFSVTATGISLIYQWQVSTDDGNTYADIPGATSSVLTFTGVTASENGNFYRVLVYNGNFICGSVNSATAVLYISADTDNDGIIDAVDLDDDNDGIYDIDELATCSETDPVVTNTIFFENFGVADGTRVSTPFTNYLYESGPTVDYDTSVNDGEYTIFEDIQATAIWASSIWQSIGDHTTGTDRMAIFNANDTAGLEFYRRTLTNVDINAPVDISLWVLNLDLNIPENDGRPEPNITISLEQNGITVYSFDTGVIPREANGDPNAWKNYTGSFTPVSSDPIEIVMVNNVIGGGGNDLAIDDILITQSFCDSDGDGIINTLEVDSDGDGCYDVTEAGFTDPDNDGFLGNFPVTVNPDGTVIWSDGYTTPADGNSNTIYDFTEAGTIPSIVVQPANRVAYAGGTSEFIVNANGDTYQWQVSNDGGINFINVTDNSIYSGTATNTLAINTVNLDMNEYAYKVIISNSGYKCDSITSSTVLLYVRVKTVITNRQITYRVRPQ